MVKLFILNGKGFLYCNGASFNKVSKARYLGLSSCSTNPCSRPRYILLGSSRPFLFVPCSQQKKQLLKWIYPGLILFSELITNDFHFDQWIQLMVRQHMASSLRECSSRLLPPCFLRSNSYLGFLAYSALSSLGLTILWWIIWCHSRNHPFLLRWSSILVKAACSNHALFIE